MRFDPTLVREASDLIIAKYQYTWAYFCQFRFALAVGQRCLMADLPLTAPSLEIGINDGSSATIAHSGKPKFTWGGDMPEANTYESMGLHLEPQFDKYENVIGMDAHEIPFPNDSFNTIVINDVLGYGLDREKIVRELTRVLAPGGTLFLTEGSSAIAKYPHLMTELRKVVPSFDFLEDAVATYRQWFEALGMVDIQGSTWLDHYLCSLLFASMHRGEVKNVIDDSKRGFYDESLRSLAHLLEQESAEGWQVFMRCRKPGQSRALPKPLPVCLACGHELEITLDGCSCRHCKRAYRNEWGNPYVLSDFTKVYSPKTIDALPSTERLRDYLDGIARQLPRSIALDGFGRWTRYTIRALQEHGISTTVIYSDDPLHEGSILGIPIEKKNPGVRALALPTELISLAPPAESLPPARRQWWSLFPSRR